MESEIRRPIAKGARRCAFTGYRPMKMPFGYDEECPLALDFKHRLHDTIEMLILQGYKHMISGGAQGMDIMAAEAVLDLQKDYPEVTLEIAVPYESQAVKWPSDYRARWQECIDRADVVTVLSHEYTKGCLLPATAIWSRRPTSCWLASTGKKAERRTRWSMPKGMGAGYA